MKYLLLLFGILISTEKFTNSKTCNLPAKGKFHFPANFMFGVATSAYQIEGGWNADGKGPSIWDDFTHNDPDKIDDKTNGDVTVDSYNLFDQDLGALLDLKVKHYRFSIAWTRIFPNGDISSRNQKGIDYYNTIIDKLILNGIEPMITMFHFDMPSELQKIGGSVNSLIINQFVIYATELFKNFGDRVKFWITFNEPLLYCKSGFGIGNYPPQIKASGIADYICIDNTLKAHAATYRLYKSKFFEKQGGKIGIALDSQFSIADNFEAFNRAMQFTLGFLARPIFSKSGGYPEIIVNTIGNNSLNEGRIVSRLPQLDDKWKDIIRGSADFLGLNYYTSCNVKLASEPLGPSPSWEKDYNLIEYSDNQWVRGKPKWLYCVPQGLEKLLKYIRDEYENPEVIITENGWSDHGELNDDNRVQYLKSHLQAVLNAIDEGCNVSGFTYWSLLDNFEWQRGFTMPFGLYAVNMSSPSKERIPKKSVSYYKSVIETFEISKNEP